MDLKKGQKINCFKCKHYHVTWQPSFPNGCKAYGFKSTYLPSVLVYQSTGNQCTCFELSKKTTNSSSV